MKKLRALILLLAAALSAPAFAGPGDDALNRFVNDVKTLSATFEQTQYDEHGEILSQRSGVFDLQRPGRFRWKYSKPYEQLMVCDGDKIWNYEPDLAQVTVRPANIVLKGTPASLLAQKGQLGDSFKIESGGKQDGADLVKLVPKNDGEQTSDFELIELWIAPNGVPKEMKFHDALGGITDVLFGGVKTGVSFDASLFRFAPPKGTEVVGADGNDAGQ
ncbi:outer membrane lipoprotein chaperone LolA [Solimonas marina]|uniref:Outer-membrane lipoprotein carrier protein n=1 Tax=Solimonas marina TaxID=2714601 RepID=A0A969W8T3_9GAMM|nr:outer membrane lipoprotein chaperone LolA [Solimonas marina]NKF22497.1 outer membrane lipoprotein chaperone LolA [Solimonas marina]